MLTAEKMTNANESQANSLANEDRITILADSFGQAALEFHRRRMAEQGYRLENRIAGHKFFRTDGMELSGLFEGETLYAVTFVKDK